MNFPPQPYGCSLVLVPRPAPSSLPSASAAVPAGIHCCLQPSSVRSAGGVPEQLTDEQQAQIDFYTFMYDAQVELARTEAAKTCELDERQQDAKAFSILLVQHTHCLEDQHFTAVNPGSDLWLRDQERMLDCRVI